MKEIEIPFGAKDSELKGWEYTIPEGMEAEIKDGKIVVREKESEDERIRMKLYHTVLGTPDTSDWFNDISKDAMLAYLEKQKEHSMSTEETELNSLAFLSQMDYTCIPPKKEHQNSSDAPKNALGGALNSPLDKDKNLDDIAQDYVEAVKEYNPEPTWNLMQTAVCYGYHYREEKEQKPVEPSGKLSREEYLYQLLIDQLITYLDYEYLTGKKPAEWSEEEKDKLNSIERLIVNANAHGNYLIGDKEAIDLQHFIRSIVKPTTNLAEWSAEDEKMRNSILDKMISLDNAYGGDGIAYGSEIAWLKSLRPQKTPQDRFKEAREKYEVEWKEQKHMEWSEEDEEKLNQIDSLLWLLDDYVGDDCSLGQEKTDSIRSEIQNVLSPWLKSLRPSWKPSEVCYGAKGDPDPAGVWKPSEKQIEALEYVIRDYREDSCNATANYLQEILDHLKNV